MLRQASRRKSACWLEGQSRCNMRIHTHQGRIFNRQRNSLLLRFTVCCRRHRMRCPTGHTFQKIFIRFDRTPA
ncbi:YciY family protein [Salmonella enterica subsp. enterica]|nr:YciY family protein [Salmonella enterica subsp. enterica]